MLATILLLSCNQATAPDAQEAPVDAVTAPADKPHGHGDHSDAGEIWTCPMHPEITSTGPGTCSECNMALVKSEKKEKGEGHMARMERVRGALQVTLGERYQGPVPGLDAADAVAGATLYQRSCETCHGVKGEGDGTLAAGLPMQPANLADPSHARYYSDAGRMEIIRNGIEGTPMVGFSSQLGEKQLLDLYAFVAGLRGDEPKAAPHDHSAHGH